MSTVSAVQGVDDTLREITKRAVATLQPRPEITVGPLDRPGNDLRLNWWLFRISPNAAYRNLPPPSPGARPTYRRPPLALGLSYLLTALPRQGTGDEEQFAHNALVAAMAALHAHAIVPDGDDALSPYTRPLVEPLRITLLDLTVDELSKLWTGIGQPQRLSVGYSVSLVGLEPPIAAEPPAAPVVVRRVTAVPSAGPRLLGVRPQRASHGERWTVSVAGLTDGASFSLASSAQDLPNAPDWPLTVDPGSPAGTVALPVPAPTLPAGVRLLKVAVDVDGVPIRCDSIPVTVVPAVVADPGPLHRGVTVPLQTAHATPSVEVFLGGRPVEPSAVTYVSAVRLDVTVPHDATVGASSLLLRVNAVSGPPAEVVVEP